MHNSNIYKTSAFYRKAVQKLVQSGSIPDIKPGSEHPTHDDEIILWTLGEGSPTSSKILNANGHAASTIPKSNGHATSTKEPANPNPNFFQSSTHPSVLILVLAIFVKLTK